MSGVEGELSRASQASKGGVRLSAESQQLLANERCALCAHHSAALMAHTRPH